MPSSPSATAAASAAASASEAAEIPIVARLAGYGQRGLRVPVRGHEVAQRLGRYTSFLEWLPATATPAIREPLNQDRAPLTHRQLRHFLQFEFDLTPFGVPEHGRVAILVPNGPELAVATIATISRWCAAPINPTNTWQEIQSELESTKAVAIMILAGATTNEAAIKAAASLGLGVIVLTPHGSTSGLFRLAQMEPAKLEVVAKLVATTPRAQPPVDPDDPVLKDLHHPETVMLLHTSGTSGNKKLVPYSMDTIVIGVGCIVSSWALTPNDVCLNMMPLFHIGGLVRNILSPILSGGCVITCPGFDPILFWDILYQEPKESRFTWYYAAPTMHHAILLEAERRPAPLPVSQIRYIANAAGGLLPALAESLKRTFDATILTSYGMTECMPISSPPQNYALDPTGTSGTPVGPDVLIVDDNNCPVPANTKGNILVAGPPCFSGYENSASATEESFVTINGRKWFNTGDMGSLDEKSYLFISGRSKEIINRGGETISPFEIEEAIVQHPFVQEVLAFSAPHEKYQETVGTAIVPRAGSPLIDLPSLHKFLESRLHRSKWPQVIVFMKGGLPKNAAGKILRIRFAERSKMANIDEEGTSPLTRLFTAQCPSQGAPLHTPILLTPMAVAPETAETALLHQFRDLLAQVSLTRVDLPFRQDAFVAFVVLQKSVASDADSLAQLQTKLRDFAEHRLDQFLAPALFHVVPTLPSTPTAAAALALQVFAERNVVAPRNAIETQIEAVWRQQLESSSVVSVTESFFDLGGDSLKAGQLINAMRKKLKIQLSVADLFTAPTIEAMAHKVSTMKTLGSPNMTTSSKLKAKRPAASVADEETGPDKYVTWESASPHSSTSWMVLITTALPLLFIYPIRRISMWFLVSAPWVYLMGHGWGRFRALVMAMVLARLVTGIVAPLLGVLAKWLIIGKYQVGRYPLWGSMHMRVWLVDQIISIMGRGYYRDDIPIVGPGLTRLYLVLMGASVGSNVRVHRDAKVGQFDLLTLEDGVAIDNATVRPFALEEGHFVLLPIHIGANSSIATKCSIAPGAVLPPNTNLCPLSSSHEMEDDSNAPHHRHYCRTAFPSPPVALIIFLGIPILLLVLAVSLIPWYVCLHAMVADAKSNGWYHADLHTIFEAFLWWITPRRLFYYFLLRIVRRCIVPFFRVFCAVVIKKVLIGPFVPCDADAKAQPWNRFRYWLMSRLLPGGNLAGLSRIVGSHYEIISVVYRLLGAKIGKHVYWPGSGLDIVEFDLLEIGDDVVFGSRSVIMTSSAVRSAKVVFESGVMVADRCVVMPGVKLRRGAVLGSGTLAAEDFEAPMGSIWVGSRDGHAVNAAPADPTFALKDTQTPFGRAFYDREAPYWVIPLWLVVLYNTLWQAFCTCFRNCHVALSLILCDMILVLDRINGHSPYELFKLTFISFVPLHLFLCLLALAIDIGGKWLILGRRKQGTYSWDQSSYCQRWQIYLTLQEIRRAERPKTGVLDLIRGTPYLVWYFRLLGSDIGKDVCLYPNGGDPMMTEPDLVSIGDRAAVDDASLIAHINTRGVFRLNPVVVGKGCVLKSMTRLLSGATMEDHTIMQEHTLVLAGESVDMGSVWQGWPSEKQISLEQYRESARKLLDRYVRQQLDVSGLARERTKKTSSKKGYVSIATEDDTRALPQTVPFEINGTKPLRGGSFERKASSEKKPLLGSKTSYGST